MDRVVVNAPAKINLTLNIEGRRDDGYHLLSSVFQAISLADRVEIRKTDRDGIDLTMSDPSLACDRRNTAYRAAEVFFDKVGRQPRVSMYIEKMIPQQAGLGGGSADAAAVLVGLNALFQTDLTTAELCDLGEQVGADVPFCIVGGTAMVTGIGEIIEPIAPLPMCHIVVAKPDIGVSTVAAYAAVDAVKTVAADQTAMRCAIENGDLTAVGRLLSNAFEQALSLEPVQECLQTMHACSPFGCSMSGSGSAVFALFKNDEAAEVCVNRLSKAVKTYHCYPLRDGACVIG